MRSKTGILLVNLGTPDSPKTSDVRKYLKEFLLDRRVIDIGWLPRNLLVRLIIAPFRSPKSAKTYREVWTDEGSPLLVYTRKLAEKVALLLPKEYELAYAMRYQSPSIRAGLKELVAKGVGHIKVVPLFPQYASATTGSIFEKVMEILSTWEAIPSIEMIDSFYDDSRMISVFAELGKKYDPASYDHVLFSFHGLPERQLKKLKCGCLDKPDCCASISEKNAICYRAQCFETARLIAKELSIPESQYTICFQSRLGRDPWIQPYTSEVVEHAAKEGKKRLLVFSPAFVADCLETIYEIAIETDEDFREAGGEKVQLVESLNDSDEWAEALCDIILRPAGQKK